MNNPVIINVSKEQLLTESSIATFAAQIKNILRNVLSLEAYRAIIREEDEVKEKYIVKGSKKDVMAFADALEKEKQSYQELMEQRRQANKEKMELMKMSKVLLLLTFL